jgi:benzaldehyde dehydrogenase (NAD)
VRALGWKGLQYAPANACAEYARSERTQGDEALAPCGGVGDSGTGSRLGGLGKLEAFTETRWLTIAGEVPPYPF